MGDIDLKLIDIEKPEDMNFILGQTHFIKSVEDIYEAIVNSVPGAKFGVAFCEASGACKVRIEGNDNELKKLAEKNAANISAGHSFIVFLKDCFPLNVLNAIKNLPEVCSIYCATANPTRVVIAEAKNSGDKIIVVHHANGNLYATSAACTHKGCDLKYDVDADLLICPCHGSQFSLDGGLVKGPSNKPLKTYNVSTENGLVVITL